MPFDGAELTLPALRGLIKEHQARLRTTYAADTYTVSLVFFCDVSQRRRVALFEAFVPAARFGSIVPERTDFGACENFRFKWAH